MCNHLSNLLPFKALSTSFLQRGTSFQPPKNSCPYLECFQGTFSHPWQQWQKKSHGDNHNNTFKNRVHQTCSLKKRIPTCQTFTKFKAENSQKFGITAQIHLVPSLDSLCSDRQFFASAQHMQPCHAARAKSHTPLPVASSPSVASHSWERHSFRPSRAPNYGGTDSQQQKQRSSLPFLLVCCTG